MTINHFVVNEEAEQLPTFHIKADDLMIYISELYDEKMQEHGSEDDHFSISMDHIFRIGFKTNVGGDPLNRILYIRTAIEDIELTLDNSDLYFKDLLTKIWYAYKKRRIENIGTFK